MNPTWMQQGNCHSESPEVFFPSDGIGVIRAQQICLGCPVKAECLTHALSMHIEHGVWGGTSERQRQRMRRQLHLVGSPSEADSRAS